MSPDEPDLIRQFLAATGQALRRKGPVEPPYPVVYDTTGQTMKDWSVWTTETYRGREIPQPIASTFIVDPAGIVRFKHVGQGTDHGDRPDIDVLLATVRRLARDEVPPKGPPDGS